jgi:recombination protein RecA
MSKGSSGKGKRLPSASFDPRALAKKISDSINKGKAAKNKRERPIRTGADADNADIIRYLSTGTSALDVATGGGIPCGRMTMIYGEESAGKSLILESAILAAQLRGGIGIVADAEHTFNKARFSAKGGNIDKVIFMQPESLEQAFEYTAKTIKTAMAEPSLIGKPMVVGWDTIGAMLTENKAKGNDYASGMIEKPRVINDGMKLIQELISSSNVAFIVLNQMYWGLNSKRVAPGGKGLRFFSSMILFLQEEDVYFSHRTGRRGKILKADIEKNKANPPAGDWIFFACDSMGVDDAMSIYFNLKPRGVGTRNVVDYKVFKKAGGWSSYQLSDDEDDKVSWQGDKGFYIKAEQTEALVPALAEELWDIWPPAEPAFTKADEEFVSFFKKDNPWVEEDKSFARCLISDHVCPVATWKECRKGFWTECMLDLDDVKTIERVYHDPPKLAVLQAMPEDGEEEEEYEDE